MFHLQRLVKNKNSIVSNNWAPVFGHQPLGRNFSFTILFSQIETNVQLGVACNDYIGREFLTKNEPFCLRASNGGNMYIGGSSLDAAGKGWKVGEPVRV